MAMCGVAQLVSDTRFFNEDTLRYFFESLVAATETGDGLGPSQLPSLPLDSDLTALLTEGNGNKVIVQSSSNPNVVENDLVSIMTTVSESLLSTSSFELISTSSVSWLENLLVESSLRNRDRLSVFWDLLAEHYETTIQNAVLLTYALERRITALFRLSARMINRDVFTNPILELFRLFIPSGKGRSLSQDETQSSAEVDGPDAHGLSRRTSASLIVLGPSGLSGALMVDLAGQISAGMWRVLTTNLEVLPTLTLSQWQIVFDVVGKQCQHICIRVF